MRAKLIEDDYVDCVIGLGKNLFYNSVMEACIVICRKNKPPERKGKILFINGFEEVVEEKQQAYLSEENIKTLFDLYTGYKNVPKKSYVAPLEEVIDKDYNLNVPLYVQKYDLGEIPEPIGELVKKWSESSQNIKKSSEEIFSVLKKVGLDDQ